MIVYSKKQKVFALIAAIIVILIIVLVLAVPKTSNRSTSAPSTPSATKFIPSDVSFGNLDEMKANNPSDPKFSEERKTLAEEFIKKYNAGDFHNIDGRRNYYAILGLPTGASKDEIKKSYKELSRKLHPDKNGYCGEVFKIIVDAYSSLDSLKV